MKDGALQALTKYLYRGASLFHVPVVMAEDVRVVFMDYSKGETKEENEEI